MRINKIIPMLIVILVLIQATFAISTQIISSSPSPIIAGDYADITLRFTNQFTNSATSIKDLTIGIEKTQFIQPITDTYIIGKMQSGETITKTFRVFFSSELNQGFINLPININYGNIKVTNKIRVYISKSLSEPQIEIGQITSIPTQILRDTKNNHLNINLQNLGDRTADLLKVELISDSNMITPSNSYSFEDSISSIPAGNSSIAKFMIDIKDNISEEIPAKLKLRFRTRDLVGNSYKIINKTLDFKIRVTPAPFLIVENVEQLSDFKIGSTENLVKIRIKNLGAVDAKEVRVRAISDISYPLIYEETTKYVTAKIKTNQSAEVIFKVEVSKTGEVRDYNSILVLESIVGENRYSREDNFKISTYPGKTVKLSFYGYLILVVLIIISIIIGINTLIKRKKENKK